MQGSYPLEGRAGSPELERGALLLSVCAERVGEVHPCECRLVRCANIAPLLGRGLEVTERARRIADCQSYPSLSEGRTGRKRLALKECRHAPELVGGRPGPIEVAGGNLDLDLRLEEW